MLPASELLQIQQDAMRAACDLPCAVQRSTRTPLASGGAALAWSTISPDGLLAGMAEPSAGALANYGYLVADQAAWSVRLPVGTDVLERDHLIIAGETLEVVKIMTPRSYAALLTVLASEVK